MSVAERRREVTKSGSTWSSCRRKRARPRWSTGEREAKLPINPSSQSLQPTASTTGREALWFPDGQRSPAELDILLQACRGRTDRVPLNRSCKNPHVQEKKMLVALHLSVQNLVQQQEGSGTDNLGRFERPPTDSRHTLLKSDPLVQSRGLYWDGFNHASVVAQHEDFQTPAMMGESFGCRTHGTFLSVFSEVCLTAQNSKKKKKVIETIEHDQHWVFNCYLMCLQWLFLPVNPYKSSFMTRWLKKKKCLIAYASNYMLGFVDIHTHIVDWDEWNKATGQKSGGSRGHRSTTGGGGWGGVKGRWQRRP